MEEYKVLMIVRDICNSTSIKQMEDIMVLMTVNNIYDSRWRLYGG
jgi:flavoprotein